MVPFDLRLSTVRAMIGLDALYASLEAGECPLSVVADRYEESGLGLAAGLRWLANNDKAPRAFGRGWYWYRFGEPACQLPEPIFEGLDSAESFNAKRFATLRAALEGAARATIEFAEG